MRNKNRSQVGSKTARIGLNDGVELLKALIVQFFRSDRYDIVEIDAAFACPRRAGEARPQSPGGVAGGIGCGDRQLQVFDLVL